MACPYSCLLAHLLHLGISEATAYVGGSRLFWAGCGSAVSVRGRSRRIRDVEVVDSEQHGRCQRAGSVESAL